MTLEAVTSGENIVILRKQLPPVEPQRRELSASQLEWCRMYLKAFAWPKVEARKS